MNEYRYTESKDEQGVVGTLEKAVSDGHGGKEWQEDMKSHVPAGTTDADVEELEKWKAEQEAVIPDNIIKGIKEIENFLQSTPDTQTLAALLQGLTQSLTQAISAKYTKPQTGIPANDLAEDVIPTVPTKVSEFDNDAGYLKPQDIEEKANKADTLAGYGILDGYTQGDIGKLNIILSLSALSETSTITKTTNPEWKCVLTDHGDKVLLGIKQDNTWEVYASLNDILDCVIESYQTI